MQLWHIPGQQSWQSNSGSWASWCRGPSGRRLRHRLRCGKSCRRPTGRTSAPCSWSLRIRRGGRAWRMHLAPGRPTMRATTTWCRLPQRQSLRTGMHLTSRFRRISQSLLWFSSEGRRFPAVFGQGRRRASPCWRLQGRFSGSPLQAWCPGCSEPPAPARRSPRRDRVPRPPPMDLPPGTNKARWARCQHWAPCCAWCLWKRHKEAECSPGASWRPSRAWRRGGRGSSSRSTQARSSWKVGCAALMISSHWVAQTMSRSCAASWCKVEGWRPQTPCIA
mmetsp:Transcript_73155/g.237929  ORF Transcript_73155/g.237929 Transcript_73155/m.237929 type:complete len:278 (+) Transcript_73155:215-1048(+)